MQSTELEEKPEVMENTVSQYVTFRISKEIYGVDVARVQEVLNLVEITYMPNFSSFMKGVIDLRGDIVPLIDMRMKFKIEEKEYDENTAIVIVELHDKLFGMIVDTVLDVVNLSIDEVSESDNLSDEHEREFVKGIGRINDNLIIVLDVNKLLSNDDLKQIG